MEVIKTAIEGLLIIEPKVFKDSRGYFFESFSQREFEEKIGPINFVQDNESMSSYGGGDAARKGGGGGKPPKREKREREKMSLCGKKEQGACLTTCPLPHKQKPQINLWLRFSRTRIFFASADGSYLVHIVA